MNTNLNCSSILNKFNKKKSLKIQLQQRKNSKKSKVNLNKYKKVLFHNK